MPDTSDLVVKCATTPNCVPTAPGISQPTTASVPDGVSKTLYQKVLEWGKKEHHFKMALIFHTNNH